MSSTSWIEYNRDFDPEELVTCPYNPAHTVLRKRMAIHLVKCRKQHGEVAKEFKNCPFNMSHKIPRLEFNYHLQECTERSGYFSSIYKVGEVHNDIVPALDKNTRKRIEIEPCQENWAEESSQSPFVNIIQGLEAQVEKKVVLRNFTNMTKSERKQKREDGRRAYCEKLNERESQCGSSRASTCSSSVSNTIEDDRSLASFNSESDDDDDDKSTASFETVRSRSTMCSDISFQSAMEKAKVKNEEFQVVERKRRIGRGSALPMSSNTQPSIGRGQLRKNN